MPTAQARMWAAPKYGANQTVNLSTLEAVVSTTLPNEAADTAVASVMLALLLEAIFFTKCLGACAAHTTLSVAESGAILNHSEACMGLSALAHTLQERQPPGAEILLVRRQTLVEPCLNRAIPCHFIPTCTHCGTMVAAVVDVLPNRASVYGWHQGHGVCC